MIKQNVIEFMCFSQIPPNWLISEPTYMNLDMPYGPLFDPVEINNDYHCKNLDFADFYKGFLVCIHKFII